MKPIYLDIHIPLFSLCLNSPEAPTTWRVMCFETFRNVFRTLLLNRYLKIHISGEICKHVFMPPLGIYILVTELNS